MPFEPEWLYLNELLPLLGPSLDLAHVETVVSRALDEGRLWDRTGTPVNAWHERFEQADGKFVFDWTSGVMIIPYWDRGRREYQPRPIRPQFRRADFLALFEVTEEPTTAADLNTAEEKPPTKTARADLDRWYMDRVEKWPQGQDPPSRNDDHVAAREKFPGVSRDWVRDARKRLAPPSWPAKGKRKSRKPFADHLREDELNWRSKLTE